MEEEKEAEASNGDVPVVARIGMEGESSLSSEEMMGAVMMWELAMVGLHREE